MPQQTLISWKSDRVRTARDIKLHVLLGAGPALQAVHFAIPADRLTSQSGR